MRATVLRDNGTCLLGTDIPTGTAEFSPDWNDDDPDAATYRYVLTRTWDAGTLPIALLMLNPSKATHLALDPTVKRQTVRAQRLGAGGLIVLNMFALRSTDPRVLLTHPDPVGPDNDEAIVDLLSRPLLALIVAWGSDAAVRAGGRAREKRVAELIGSYTDHRPMCLRQLDGGHPGHPLYVPYEAPLLPWVAA